MLQEVQASPQGAGTPKLGGCGPDAVWEEKTDSMEEEWEVKPEDEEDSDPPVQRQQSSKLVPGPADSVVTCTTDSSSLQDQHCLQQQLLEAQGEIAGLRLALEAARRREQCVASSSAPGAGSGPVAGFCEEPSASSSSMSVRRQASGGTGRRREDAGVGAVAAAPSSSDLAVQLRELTSELRSAITPPKRQSSSPSRVTAQRLQDLRLLEQELQAQRLSLGRLARGASMGNQARSRTPSPEFTARVGERKRMLESVEKAVGSLRLKIIAEASKFPPPATHTVVVADPCVVDLRDAVKETVQTLNGLRAGQRSLTPPVRLANALRSARSASPRSGQAQVHRSLTPPAGTIQTRQAPLMRGLGAGYRNRRPMVEVLPAGASSATYLHPDRAQARSPLMTARQPLASCPCFPAATSGMGASPVDSSSLSSASHQRYAKPVLREGAMERGNAVVPATCRSPGCSSRSSSSAACVLPAGTLASARGFSTTSTPCFVASPPCLGSGSLSSGCGTPACATAVPAARSGWSRPTPMVLPPEQCWGVRPPAAGVASSCSSTRGLPTAALRATCAAGVRNPGRE